MSYWAGEAIAHTIVSFGFDDGAWLAFSIETRKQRDEFIPRLRASSNNMNWPLSRLTNVMSCACAAISGARMCASIVSG